MDPAKAAKFSARFPGHPDDRGLRRGAGRPARRGGRGRHAAADALRASCAGRSRPASTCWSRSRWRRTVADAEELVELAEARGLVLMPGHTFLYSPPVNKIHELIGTGELGDIYFVTSSRMNLGLYQPDGVVCDLAPHDLSILLYWLDQPVVGVTALGLHGLPATASPRPRSSRLRFEGGTTANVQVSWLAPRKVRQMVVVGSQRMVQYDDGASDDAVRVYDRGLDWQLRSPRTSASTSSPTARATWSPRGSTPPSR